MDYFLKASAIIALFYLCYKLFLQRETYFQSNRWFLISGLFIATILPLVVIPVYIEYSPTPLNFSGIEQTFSTTQNNTEASLDIVSLLFYAYAIGIITLTTKLLIQFLSLKKIFKNNKKTKKGNYLFIETDKEITPFSFFNRIVYNTSSFSQVELNHIITHEKVHASQLHSIDVLIAQLATIIFWFNPFVWLYKKEVQQNLEFIADYEAQNKIECSKSYQTVMLKASITNNQLSISNNFYQSLIKKRIVMLQKSKSNKYSKLKLIIILPFLALFLMSFNVEEIYVAKENTTQNIATDTTYIITSKASDKDIEHIKSKLEADSQGLKIKFTNLKRNADGEIINLSIETKLKGKSKYNHNITYGNDLEIPISTIHLKIEKGELVFGDQEQNMVMRVTERGVVADQFPIKEKTPAVVKVYSYNDGDNIKLKVDSDNKEDSSYKVKVTTKNTGTEKSKLEIVNAKEEPLYVIDGEIVDKKETDLNTENIATVNILKGETASTKYGDKGKNGVVEIVTKKEDPWKVSKKVTYVNVEATPIKYDANNVKETIIVNQTTTNKSSQTDITKALIIIDGVKTKNEALKALNPDMIKSMSVLKDKNATNKYGKEGENGVILITTKQNDKTSTTTKKESKKKSGPWEITNTEVSSLTYIDDEDATKNGSSYFISMTTPKEILEQHKRSLQAQDIELKYLTIKRNSKGKITKLKLSVEDKKGKKSKVTYQANKGISTVKISLDGIGNVNISSE